MKRKKKKPNGWKSCSAKTKAGKACQRPVQEGSDKCYFHNGGAKKAGAKGHATMSADAKAIEKSLKRLDIRSPENQKKHLAHLIWEMLDSGESFANIARFYQMLISITQEQHAVAAVVINRTIIPPE